MRHFDAWVIRDPYSIFHYYTTGQRWKDTVRDLIHDRKICAPSLNSNPQLPSPPSTSSSSTSTSTPTFIQQTKSPLFTRLPPEIRAIIWSYVFGNDTLHLVTVKNKVRHVRCSSSGSSSSSTKALTHHRHCCPTTLARWRNSSSPNNTTTINSNDNNLLYPHTNPHLPSTLSSSSPSLLLTCRAIYTETSTLIYKNSTFDIDDLYTFIAFTQSLPLHALSHIHRLTIQWSPIWTPLSGQDHKNSIYAHTHSDALWLQFWARVASLPSLREIKLSIDLGSFTGTVTPSGGVVLGGSGVRLPLGVGELWTVPLLGVRGLETFEMAVTARCDVVARGVLEESVCGGAGRLRDWLRGVMCSARDVGLSDILGEREGDGFGLDRGRLRVLEEWMRREEEEKEKDVIGKRSGQRLAIMAA
ncbi:uncharacterized protein N7473_011689 [Penicillium subrubescens]|uniref:uncharacterized protein n=1 Tax=Penicillium subrubescens TaxID=1316194 RepID=UPI0025458771|nr:uncharacterized protein N7473_011689 [Penicillium subrubescens]KAJ5880636.1 hypothetical protein N7473_011689 [Penicillium subrubescens]